MKKFMLSLLILAGTFTAVLSFHACSADDEAEEPQHSPQAQLLLQKSREFAKKYDVNMALNEDNIEETAKTLSVEQMEKDFREMENFQISFKLINPNRTVNKLRVRKKITTFEETKATGSFTWYGEGNTSVNVEYTIGNGNYNNDVYVTLNTKGHSGSAHFKPVGCTSYGTNDCAFSASGTVIICSYYIAYYHVLVDHGPSGNYCNISLDHK